MNVKGPARSRESWRHRTTLYPRYISILTIYTYTAVYSETYKCALMRRTYLHGTHITIGSNAFGTEIGECKRTPKRKSPEVLFYLYAS